MAPTRFLIASVVTLAHIEAIALIPWVRPMDVTITETDMSTFVSVIPANSLRSGVVPLSIVRLSALRPDSPTLLDITFEDPDADLVPGVIGSSSVPRPILGAMPDQLFYAQRAGLLPGESATVVLSIQVRADGSTGEVIVQGSSGNLSVDAEAAAFVRAIHWIPGTANRRAVEMRLQYPVTLTATVS